MRNFILAGLMAALSFQSSLTSNLIPREKLFVKPACMAVKLSPDETRLAWVGANREGAMNIFISQDLTLKGVQATHFTDPEIRAFHWTSNGKKIVFLKDKDGTKQYRLYLLDITTLELKDLTQAYDKINAKIFQMGKNENKAVVGLNFRNPKFHDLYLVDFDTGTLSQLFENDAYVNFLFDDKLRVALKIALNPDSSQTVFDKNNKKVLTLSAEDAFNSDYLFYDTTEDALYLSDTRDSNTSKLKKISLKNLHEDVLAHNHKSDILEVIFEENKPIAYSTYFTEKSWSSLNPKMQRELDFLFSKVSPNSSIDNMNKDGKYWVITSSIPDKGVEIWLFNRSSKELVLLFSYPGLENLAKMYPLVIPSQDGLELVSYLTLPLSQDVQGRPKKPLPLVIIPHGGPFKVRDFYNYSEKHQWLANRGYAVLSINFRLSAGFGKNFVSAGNGQWGKNAHRDILDVIQFCIDNKIADPEKITVFGGSYGGFEALTSLTQTPETFACAVDICGPTNLRTVLYKTPFYWELPKATLSDRMNFYTSYAFHISCGGDPHTPEGIRYLEECSPITYVKNIQKPLMIVHGANDPIVAASESEQILAKCKEKKLPVIYILFPDEGHGVDKYANLMCSLAYSEWLFAKFLGGDFEPLKEKELKRSSAKIETFGFDEPVVVTGPSNLCIIAPMN